MRFADFIGADNILTATVGEKPNSGQQTSETRVRPEVA